MFSTNEIDRRLGFFQNEFHLSGDEVRSVVTRFPKLVLHNMQKINVSVNFKNNKIVCIMCTDNANFLNVLFTVDWFLTS